VRRLQRVGIGSVNLDRLPMGQWRYLTSDEIYRLLQL